MSAPSYQQLANEVKLPPTTRSEGPMNFAVFDDSGVPEGGGTPIEALVRPMPEPQEPPQISVPQMPAYAPQKIVQEPPRPNAYVQMPAPDLRSLDDKSKASLLVFALYLVVSSSYFQKKAGDVFPEIFGNPSGFLAYLARGLTIGLSFYLIQKYMVKTW